MTDRSAQVIGAGTTATYHAASGGGDRFRPADDTFLHVKNASGSSITVTLVTPATADGLAVADLVVTVPAASDRFIRPPADRLVKDTDGMAAITWSSATSVTFAVLNV